MSGEPAVKVHAHYGVLCVRNEPPRIQMDGPDVGGLPYSPVADGLLAALPWFGALVGLVLGELLAIYLRSPA